LRSAWPGAYSRALVVCACTHIRTDFGVCSSVQSLTVGRKKACDDWNTPTGFEIKYAGSNQTSKAGCWAGSAAEQPRESGDAVPRTTDHCISPDLAGARPRFFRPFVNEALCSRQLMSKLCYNLVLTAVSVAVAGVIGGIEAFGLAGDQLGLQGGVLGQHPHAQRQLQRARLRHHWRIYRCLDRFSDPLPLWPLSEFGSRHADPLNIPAKLRPERAAFGARHMPSRQRLAQQRGARDPH
jgi:hypothetical protein